MMTAVFVNSPFDKEVRIDCKEFKAKSSKYGEIVILPKHRNNIFTISEGSNVELKAVDNTIVVVDIKKQAVVRIDSDKIFIFGEYKIADDR